MLGFAVAGLLLGHALSYAIAIPDPHHRDLVLSQSGHAYLQPLGQAALIVLLAAVVTVVVRACSRRREQATERFGVLAGTLAAIQVGAFVGQEVVERLVAGSPLAGLAHDHVLAVGLAAQVVVAIAGALVLRWLARQAERLANVSVRIAGPPRPAGTTTLLASTDRPRGRVTKRADNVRAPPLADASPAI
jgi:hypothetical protein